VASLKATGAGFADLAAKFDRLADRYPRLAAEKGAAAAQKCIDREYANEAGPDGTKWKQKKRPNGKPQGQASGETMASAKAIPGPNADILLSVEGAASYLQNGTSRMDARQILPEGKLDPEWAEPIDDAAHDAIHEAYEGR